MSSFTRGAKVTRKQLAGVTSAAATPAAEAAAAPALVAAPIAPVAQTTETRHASNGSATAADATNNTSASISASTSAASSLPVVSPVPAAVVGGPVAQPIRPSAAGCRSWIHGLTLTSSGVSGIDALLGGGISLGSVVCMRDDSSADGSVGGVVSCLTPFLQSFVADGVGFGHRVLLVHESTHDECDSWLASLPRNVTLEKRRADAVAEETALRASAAAQQQLDLKIAWRYQQYMDRPLDTKANLGSHKLTGASSGSSSSASSARSVSSATLSASYDYQSTISSQLLRSNPPAVISVQEDIMPLLPAYDAEPRVSDDRRTALIYRHVLAQVAAFVDAAPAGSVSRILLHSIGSLGWCATPSSQSRSLLVFLSHLRQLVSTRPVIVMFSLPPALLPTTIVRRVAHTADIVLSLSGFSIAAASASAAILGDYDGLLRIDRCAARHSLLSPGGAAAGVVQASDSEAAASAANSHCFLFKCTRRKIIIEKFALPPDAEEAADTPPTESAREYVPNITTRGTSAPRARPTESMIAYEPDSIGVAAPPAVVTGAHLSRHGPAVVAASKSSAARARDSPLHAILHGRSSVPRAGCGTRSAGAQPQSKLDF